MEARSSAITESPSWSKRFLFVEIETIIVILEYISNSGDGSPKALNPLVSTTLTGPLCFSGDNIASRVLLPVCQPGDRCLLMDCGANTLSLFRWCINCVRFVCVNKWVFVHFFGIQSPLHPHGTSGLRLPHQPGRPGLHQFQPWRWRRHVVPRTRERGDNERDDSCVRERGGDCRRGSQVLELK